MSASSSNPNCKTDSNEDVCETSLEKVNSGIKMSSNHSVFIRNTLSE